MSKRPNSSVYDSSSDDGETSADGECQPLPASAVPAAPNADASDSSEDERPLQPTKPKRQKLAAPQAAAPKPKKLKKKKKQRPAPPPPPPAAASSEEDEESDESSEDEEPVATPAPPAPVSASEEEEEEEVSKKKKKKAKKKKAKKKKKKVKQPAKKKQRRAPDSDDDGDSDDNDDSDSDNETDSDSDDAEEELRRIREDKYRKQQKKQAKARRKRFQAKVVDLVSDNDRARWAKADASAAQFPEAKTKSWLDLVRYGSSAFDLKELDHDAVALRDELLDRASDWLREGMSAKTYQTLAATWGQQGKLDLRDTALLAKIFDPAVRKKELSTNLNETLRGRLSGNLSPFVAPHLSWLLNGQGFWSHLVALRRVNAYILPAALRRLRKKFKLPFVLESLAAPVVRAPMVRGGGARPNTGSATLPKLLGLLTDHLRDESVAGYEVKAPTTRQWCFRFGLSSLLHLDQGKGPDHGAVMTLAPQSPSILLFLCMLIHPDFAHDRIPNPGRATLSHGARTEAFAKLWTGRKTGSVYKWDSAGFLKIANRLLLHFCAESPIKAAKAEGDRLWFTALRKRHRRVYDNLRMQLLDHKADFPLRVVPVVPRHPDGPPVAPEQQSAHPMLSAVPYGFVRWFGKAKQGSLAIPLPFSLHPSKESRDLALDRLTLAHEKRWGDLSEAQPLQDGAVHKHPGMLHELYAFFGDLYVTQDTTLATVKDMMDSGVVNVQPDPHPLEIMQRRPTPARLPSPAAAEVPAASSNEEEEEDEDEDTPIAAAPAAPSTATPAALPVHNPPTPAIQSQPPAPTEEASDTPDTDNDQPFMPAPAPVETQEASEAADATVQQQPRDHPATPLLNPGEVELGEAEPEEEDDEEEDEEDGAK